MKVYILLDIDYCEREDMSVDIIDVFVDRKQAVEKRKKMIDSNCNAELDMDWVLDEETQDLEAELVRMFYGYQENWCNYFELVIVEKEVFE